MRAPPLGIAISSIEAGGLCAGALPAVADPGDRAKAGATANAHTTMSADRDLGTLGVIVPAAYVTTRARSTDAEDATVGSVRRFGNGEIRFRSTREGCATE